MDRWIKSFVTQDDGAITTDWVVLTAFVVGMAIAIYLSLGNAAHDYGELIDATMSTRGIATY